MAFEALGELNGKFTKMNQPLVAAALYLTKHNSAAGTLTPVLEVVIRKDVLERLGWSETTRIAVYEGTGHDRNLLQLRPAKVGFTVTHRPTASTMRVSGPRLRHHVPQTRAALAPRDRTPGVRRSAHHRDQRLRRGNQR
jgi:hypothetical protein